MGHLLKWGTTSDPLQWARNDLKWPTTSKKQPELTTTSKTQPTMTWTYLQRAKKRCETTNSKQISRLFYKMEQTVLFVNRFSTQYLVAVIQALLHRESWWKQSIKHLLSYIKHQLSGVFFTGYIRFIFFCLGFMLAGKERGKAIIVASSSLLLPPAFQIIWPSACAFIGEV